MMEPTYSTRGDTLVFCIIVVTISHSAAPKILITMVEVCVSKNCSVIKMCTYVFHCVFVPCNGLST